MANNSLPIKDHLLATAQTCKSYIETTLTAVSTGLAAMIATKADKPKRIPFVINAAAWQTGSGVSGLPYMAVITANISAKDDAEMLFEPNSLPVAADAGVMGGKTLNGQIVLYAARAPVGSLSGVYSVVATQEEG